MSRIVSQRNAKRLGYAVCAVLVALLLAGGCASIARDPEPGTPQATQTMADPIDAWSALLQRAPHPYLLPLPPTKRTSLDGTFTKVELKESPPVHCLRCPDYAPEGGIWKLNLDRGTFRILYQVTGWKSIGSYVVTRDRWTSGAPDQLLLFNDPTCPDAIGLYTWKLEAGKLFLEVIDDTCAIYLRAMNLTNLPWLSCQPPNIEAGITDHWLKPPGCE
jgi:hypothetical protein